MKERTQKIKTQINKLNETIKKEIEQYEEQKWEKLCT
jgi:hypothetical protein